VQQKDIATAIGRSPSVVSRERVVGDLRKAWSPQQISGRLCYDCNRGEADMSVSHQAIYTWLYALPKGELAQMEIALRTARTRRQPRGRARSQGARIVGMTSISQRPAEAEGRQVPGHWEGDQDDLFQGVSGRRPVGIA
jgi:IS30 family transposase